MSQLLKGIFIGLAVGFLFDMIVLRSDKEVRSEFIRQYPNAPRVVLTYVTDLPVGGRKVHGIIEEGEGYTNIHYCGWNFDVYPHPKEFDLFTDLCYRMSMSKKRPPLSETFAHEDVLEGAK